MICSCDEFVLQSPGTSVTSVALHPGAVRTEILRHSDLKATLPLAYLSAIFYPLSVIFLRSPKQGNL
jgi:hypothetical protein